MEVNKPVTSIILFIIIVILVFLFVWPKYHEFGVAKMVLAKTQAEFNGGSAYYAQISEIIKEIQDRKEVLDKISSALPKEASVAPLIYFFQQKAAETGLLIRSITFSNNVPSSAASAGGKVANGTGKKTVKDMAFSLDLVGNYQGLKNFLTSLEKSARLFEVDAITLVPLQVQGASGAKNKVQTYSFKLQVKTHTY